MIVPNCSFEIQRKGPEYRQKNAKLRLIVDSVEPSSTGGGPFCFKLFTSQVKMKSPQTTKKPQGALNELVQVDSSGIGGLGQQIKDINDRLYYLTDEIFQLIDHRLEGPTAILIHGPEGTGKSLLLNRLAEAPWRQKFNLGQRWLSSNSKSQSRVLSEVFENARASQPSIIVIDELDKLLSKAETFCGDLRKELSGLEGARVLVAAATRSIYDVDSSLRTSMAFGHEVEIFAPNVKQREDILRNILRQASPSLDIKYDVLAERTHGFVGRDLRSLCGLARRRAVHRSLELARKQSVIEDTKSSTLVTQDDFDSIIDRVQPTVMKDVLLELPKVRWTDIGGLEHVRQLLYTVTVRPFKFPDLATKFGGTQSRKGVLLYGPPGCAKTLIAQAVATESNLNFLAVKGSELIKMYVGESERAIRDVFRKARAAKPCIIFFDEIDSIGKSRDKSQDSSLNVVTTLLNEMDGIETLKDVLIIGATNKPDILDSALIRPGRFDARQYVGLPNLEARRQIFHIHTKRMPLSADVDLGNLAARTEGSSGAEIKDLCAIAVDASMTEYELDPTKPPEIKMCHFEYALSTHVPQTSREEAQRYERWRPGVSLSAD